MKRTLITTTGIVLLSVLTAGAFAGEGHDHGVPGSVAAPKGGEIKPALGSFFELLKTGSTLKVYPYDDKLKALPLDALSEVEVLAKVPKGKAEKIEFTKHNDHLMMSYDPKKSHRFELTVKFKIKGKPDSVTYNVEKN